MPLGMERILHKLIVPNTVSVSEGTRELREALNNQDAIPALCSLIGTSANLQIRQLAAIVLRKKLTKHRYWLKLSKETKQFVKQGLMQSLVSEQEKIVKTAIAQVIGVLTRHEFPENGWPELMQFIHQMTLSANFQDQELGLFTLQVLTDVAGEQFLAHAHSFATMFTNILNSVQCHETNVCYLSLLCLVNFVPAVEGDQFMVNAFHGMIGQILTVIKVLSTKRPDRAVEVFTLIDELTDNAISVIVPHIKPIIETCLEICHENTSCHPDLQIKALNVIASLVTTKKKQIVKLKLVEPILEVLFALMCKQPVNDNEDDFPDVEEATNPSNVANQTLDILALHLPPDKLLPPLMQHFVVKHMNHENPQVRKATYLALAVVAEGCSDYIRQHHMNNFASYVMAGLKDPTMTVNNAALFAVGQFSEHLQPNISVYASELLGFLLEHLKKISNKEDMPEQKVERMFYALEMFCENLNEDLLPFLPELMHYLIPLLSVPYPVKLRELAISAVGACGNAVKEAMLPYFQDIITHLKAYLMKVQEPTTLCLQVQSLDTLGIFARTIGKENFLPIAQESMQLGMILIREIDDPDLRKSAYGLFASVSLVLKQDMASFLPTIMEVILKAVKSDSGTMSYKKEDNPTVGLFDNNISDSEEEEELDLGNSSDISSDDEDDEKALTVENAYLEEKEEAIVAIRDLAHNCPPEVFLPYVDTSFQEVFKMLNYPDDDIRSAAVTTLSQLCITIHKINSAEGRTALLKALDILVPKCSEIIRTDKERDVVVSCLDAYQELLKDVGPSVLEGEGHTDAIINCIKDVFNSRTECQDDGDYGEESEGDELLIESAGEIIPALGRVMPSQQFFQHYSQFLPLFFNLTNKQGSDSQRSFGVGMIAECMSYAGSNLQTFSTQLVDLLTSLATDNNKEVRNNAVFALGEFVYHGRDIVFPYYNPIMMALSKAVVEETHPGVLDNFCGAIARLIITNVTLVPTELVVPRLITYLPLREDFEENKWVFRSIWQLYQMGSKPLLENLKPLIKAAIMTLQDFQIEPENQNLIVEMLKSCQQDFPNECSAAAAELPEGVMLKFNQICAA